MSAVTERDLKRLSKPKFATVSDLERIAPLAGEASRYKGFSAAVFVDEWSGHIISGEGFIVYTEVTQGERDGLISEAIGVMVRQQILNSQEPVAILAFWAVREYPEALFAAIHDKLKALNVPALELTANAHADWWQRMGFSPVETIHRKEIT